MPSVGAPDVFLSESARVVIRITSPALALLR